MKLGIRVLSGDRVEEFFSKGVGGLVLKLFSGEGGSGWGGLDSVLLSSV